MNDERNLSKVAKAGLNLEKAAVGGPPSNTPLSNSKFGLITGGEDTAEISLFVQWSKFLDLKTEWEKLKKESQSDDNKGAFFVSGGDSWAVGPSGFRMGDELKKGPLYSWKLSWAGFVMGIRSQAEPIENDSVGNVRVRIGSELLMSVGGLKPAYDLLVAKILTMGGTVLKDKLSRVDPCVDLPNVGIEEFVAAFHEHRYISRARNWGDHHEEYLKSTNFGAGRKDTGFAIGVDIHLRAYDKVREVKSQPAKKAIMEKFRWGGTMEKAVRVEFQLRREALKKFGIDSVENWEKEKASVTKYLCEEWFRMTENKVDLSNTTRVKVLLCWLLVTEKFREWTHAKPDTLAASLIEKTVNIDTSALLLQIMGCTTTVAAELGLKIDDIGKLMSIIGIMIGRMLSKEIISERLLKKRLAFLARKPGFVFATTDFTRE
jgi:hypothetical protein